MKLKTNDAANRVATELTDIIDSTFDNCKDEDLIAGLAMTLNYYILAIDDSDETRDEATNIVRQLSA